MFLVIVQSDHYWNIRLVDLYATGAFIDILRGRGKKKAIKAYFGPHKGTLA